MQNYQYNIIICLTLMHYPEAPYPFSALLIASNH